MMDLQTNHYRYVRSMPQLILELLFSKENGGVSSARNLGLLHVQGEYVVFVDSDDFVSPKYCEHLYQLAINTKSELAS